MKSSQRKDWGEAVDVSLFHGRKTELAQVQGWIVEEHCRLVVILGMGGIGKTAFSIKLAEQIRVSSLPINRGKFSIKSR